MKKLAKDELFGYVRSLIKDKSYMGLHGIADYSDIKNEYSQLSKLEKAENMLQMGIINNRGETISHIVKIYGDISESSTHAKDINNYSFFSPSGKETIMVVAIPIFFEDSIGRKIYGGRKDYESNRLSDKAEVITDDLFKNIIPPEMIVGYYSYDKSNLNEITFKENSKYYYNLSQEEKDKFINKTFDSKLCLDVNNPEILSRMNEFAKIKSFHGQNAIKNTIDQWTYDYDWENFINRLKAEREEEREARRLKKIKEEKLIQEYGAIPLFIDELDDINGYSFGQEKFDPNNLMINHHKLDITNRLPGDEGYDPNSLKKDSPLLDIKGLLPYELGYDSNNLKINSIIKETKTDIIEKDQPMEEEVLESRVIINTPNNKTISNIDFNFLEAKYSSGIEKKNKDSKDTNITYLKLLSENLNLKAELAMKDDELVSNLTPNELVEPYLPKKEEDIIQTYKLINNIKKENDKLYRKAYGYSAKELESLSLTDIDPKKVQLNFETVVNSTHGIKEVLIGVNIMDQGSEIVDRSSLANKVGFDTTRFEFDDPNIIIAFENHLRKNNYNEDQIQTLYNQHYNQNVDYWNDMYLGELDRKQKNQIQQPHSIDFEKVR